MLALAGTGAAAVGLTMAGAASPAAADDVSAKAAGRVNIYKTSQGRIGRIGGANRLPSIGTNANVNTRGEFWIGYKKIAAC